MADYAQRYSDKQAEEFAQQIEKVYSQAAREIKEKLNAFMMKHKAKSEKLRRDVQNGVITERDYQAWLRGQVFQGKQWEQKLKDITDVYVNADSKSREILGSTTKNVFMEAANYTAYDIEKNVRGAIAFNIYDEKTVERLIKNDPKMLPEWKIDEPKDYSWNEKRVQNAVAQGIIQGESVYDIGKRLTVDLSAQNANKMDVFARTAVTGAQNAGRIERLHDAKDMGINIRKRWMATLDNRTRDSHAELDGETIDVDKKFSNGLMYPGDPSGDPSEVYNCRCTLVYIYPEYEQYFERTAYYEEGDPEYDPKHRNYETVKDMTYEQWVAFKRSASEVEETTINYQPNIQELVDSGMSQSEARIRLIEELSGFDREKSEEVRSAFQKYSAGMVNDEKITKTMDEYIEHAPTYSGKIYRGMRLIDDNGNSTYEQFIKKIKEDGIYEPKVTTSWASEETVARRYAWMRNKTVDSVVFVSEENHRVTPIEFLSGFQAEAEVTAHSKNIWEVVKVEEEKIGDAKKAYIYVREKRKRRR